ncbi:MAG: hypothetical protein PHG48_04200, partial [Eubacteriales bacterium]|nr:hypothetical protein [Eubacteriales bacterium]
MKNIKAEKSIFGTGNQHMKFAGIKELTGTKGLTGFLKSEKSAGTAAGYTAIFLAAAIFVGSFVTGCEIKEDEPGAFQYEKNTTGIWDEANSPLTGAPVFENKAAYSHDSDAEVVNIYLTVREGRETDGNEYTFNMLNAYTGYGTEPFCEAIFQEGPEDDKPLPGYFAYGEKVVNARLETRGDVGNIEPR